MSCMSTIEILPNEILIECFKYFIALDLFHSFDHLNYRFSTLIRSIPLHLNFKNVSNIKIKEFFLQIQKYPMIKQQIYSLHLSDEHELQQTKIFLSYFSLNEFPCLKSLVLTQIKSKNVNKIISMLQTNLNISCLILNCIDSSYFRMPDDMSLSKFKRLSIPGLNYNTLTLEQTWLMSSLTLSWITIQQLAKLFQYAPRLKNFTTYNLGCDWYDESEAYERVDFQGYTGTHLKRLHVEIFKENFQLIEHLLQYTPNLKVFTLIAKDMEEIIDAIRWEYLIRISLIHLRIFEFQFSCNQLYISNIDFILFKCEQFQNDFWQKEHQWLVRCEYSVTSVIIHTIPYISNEFKLCFSNEHFCSNLIDSKIIFERIIDLSIWYEMIQTSYHYFFSNVKILRLKEDSRLRCLKQQHIVDIEHIQCLNSFICLLNITDLSIDRNYVLKSASVMINLLNKASNLSSITMTTQILRCVVLDNQVCSNFSKMIKYLYLLEYKNDVLFNDIYSIERFCQTFPKLKQLKCDLTHPDELIILLHKLTELSKIEIGLPLYENIFADEMIKEQYLQIFRRDFHLIDNDIDFGFQSDWNSFAICIHRIIE